MCLVVVGEVVVFGEDYECVVVVEVCG